MKSESTSRTPTLQEKLEIYEQFLHKINVFVTIGDSEGIRELVSNADAWSYAHRRGNGELPYTEQQKLVNSSFWKLCDTPLSDASTRERQKRYTVMHTKSRRCPDCGWALYDGVYGMNDACCKGKEIENPAMLSNFEYNQKFMIKPVWKLNNGRGATLCNKCDIIISEGLTKELYCEDCSPEKKKY